MPMPLKKGFNVHVEYIEKPSTYVMRAIDIYEDFYGIGFIVSGEIGRASCRERVFVLV